MFAPINGANKLSERVSAAVCLSRVCAKCCVVVTYYWWLGRGVKAENGEPHQCCRKKSNLSCLGLCD